MNILDNVMTVTEYCEKFKVPKRTVNSRLLYGVLPEHVLSARKSGHGRTAIHLLLIDPEKKGKKR